jgi:hypothetical protein
MPPVKMALRLYSRWWEVAAQRNHHAVDEHGFAVEQVDGGVGHLAVHQQQQAVLLHGLERLVGLADVGHAGIAVGGGTGRVELERAHAGNGCQRDFLGRQLVGQVERHHGLEGDAFGHGGKDAFAVGHGLRGGGHGGTQVRHDQRAAELAGAVGNDGFEGGAIAHVQVPVVGAGDREGRGGVCHGGAIVASPPSKYSRTRARARCSRLLTAPGGSPSRSAISAMVSSSKSRSSTTSR